MARKSARSAKRKWPCGTCSFQCNDDAILCEDCGVWYHAKCDNLSADDFKVLRQMTEGYLCSSCTYNGGRFDYDKALWRLGNAVRNGMLENGVKLESILLRGTPAVQARSDELLLGKKTVDTIAKNILKKAGEIHTNYVSSMAIVRLEYIVPSFDQTVHKKSIKFIKNSVFGWLFNIIGFEKPLCK